MGEVTYSRRTRWTWRRIGREAMRCVAVIALLIVQKATPKRDWRTHRAIAACAAGMMMDGEDDG